MFALKLQAFKQTTSKTTTTILKACILIAVLILFSNTASAQVSNPTFDSNFSPWVEYTGNYGITGSWSGTEGHSANGSYYLTDSGAYLSQGGIYQNINITNGQYISFWIKTVNWGGGQFVSVRAGGYTLGSVYANSSWVHYNMTNTNGLQTTISFATCGNSGAYGNFYLDDIYIYDTPLPPSAPITNFRGRPLSGGLPLEVFFNDTSTNSPSAFEWYTDELVNDSSRNTSYIYYNSGSYNVNLKTSNSGGSDWENKTNYVTVNPDTVIWYNLGNTGLYLNANITDYINSHSDNGLYIGYYVRENTTEGDRLHSSDLVFEDGILHLFTTFKPEYPYANSSNSSLYVRYMQDGAYHDYLAGSALWTNSIIDDTLNDSSVPVPDPQPLPEPPEPNPINPPSPDPIPTPTPSPEPIPPAPEPPAPSNGSSSGNNSTGGKYPEDYAGNTSVDMGGLSGYYSYVDSAVSPLTNSVSGIINYLLSPLTALTNHINSLNTSYGESVTGTANNSFLGEIVRPIFSLIPPEISKIIIFGLILTIISFLIRVR